MVTEGFSTALPGDGTFPPPAPSEAGMGLLMGSGYRMDVLVDFSSYAEGTLIQVFNTGPDVPFAGFPVEAPADPETVGQVMRFRVVKDSLIGEDATPPQSLKLSLVDAHDPAAEPTPTSGRRLSLNEYDSQSICAFMAQGGDIVWDQESVIDPADESQCISKATGQPSNATPFAPIQTLLGTVESTVGPVHTLGYHWSSPISQIPAFNATETWELWDMTVDAHPMHLHLVRFRILGRRSFDAASGALGPLVKPNPVDAGWKDTVITLPGNVTYVKARFDIKGLYVWHCHMLEHEDSEMMLPYCVGDIGTSPGCGAAQKLSHAR